MCRQLLKNLSSKKTALWVILLIGLLSVCSTIFIIFYVLKIIQSNEFVISIMYAFEQCGLFIATMLGAGAAIITAAAFADETKNKKFYSLISEKKRSFVIPLVLIGFVIAEAAVFAFFSFRFAVIATSVGAEMSVAVESISPPRSYAAESTPVPVLTLPQAPISPIEDLTDYCIDDHSLYDRYATEQSKVMELSIPLYIITTRETRLYKYTASGEGSEPITKHVIFPCLLAYATHDTTGFFVVEKEYEDRKSEFRFIKMNDCLPLTLNEYEGIIEEKMLIEDIGRDAEAFPYPKFEDTVHPGYVITIEDTVFFDSPYFISKSYTEMSYVIPKGSVLSHKQIIYSSDGFIYSLVFIDEDISGYVNSKHISAFTRSLPQ